jgi:Ca2+-binding RTX toxin-like protein
MPEQARLSSADSRRSHRKLIRAARAAAPVVVRVDALEPRRLLAASLSDEGVLTADGTGGNDDLRLDRVSGDIIVTLNGVQDGVFDASDVEAIVLSGGDGNDSLRIGANIDGATLNGGNGDDTLLGGNEDDTLNGEAGNDTLDGKEGSDLYVGGLGFDSADYRFETADLTLSIDGVANESGGNADGDNITTDVERIVGGQGSDDITGSDGDNSLDTRGGNDTVRGGLGNDSIDGGDGDDLIAGESGNDVLTGNPGRDTLTGGAGDDAFVTNDGDADTLDGGSGDDNAVADQPGDTFTSIETGITLPAPEVEVRAGGTDLTDGVSVVNLGTVTQGQAGPTRTFTVTNTGTDVLSVGAVSVSAGFVITDPLVGPIAPGASESFTVQVDASVAGTKVGTVSFANTDADENPFTFDVTATVDPAPPQLPDVRVRLGGNNVPDGTTAAINFGSVGQNQGGPTRTFTVFNDGDAPLTVGSVTVPGGFTVTDPLVGPIAPGASESFTVRLDTASAGAKSGQVVITTNDPDEDPYNFAISGTVVAAPPPDAPEIVVTVARPAGPLDDGNSTVEFGNKVVDARGPTRTFRVTNTGTAPLTVGAVTVPAGFTLVDPLVGPIGPGETESFVVQMDTGSPGAKNGFVSVASNDGNENPFTFRVVGNVGVSSTPIPEVTMRALQRGQLRGVEDGRSAFSFGTVAADSRFRNSARTFRLFNDGDATLTLGDVSVPRGFVILGDLPSSVASGGTADLVLAVDSTSGLGAKSGTVAFTTNDKDENPFSFNVSATVALGAPGGAPEVTVTTTGGQAIADNSTAAISFGSVLRNQTSPSRTFRVRNEGNAPLTVGAVTVPAGFRVTDPLTGPIAPGGVESFTVTLETGATGSRGGAVSFATNDASESPFNFAVSGAVSAPPSSGPAVTASLSNGTLTVNGTAGIDTIAFAPSAQGLGVVGNGRAVGGSPFNGVRRITVNGQGGDDRVDGSNLAVPLTINGGAGNDVLIGGSGGDTLGGGAGNDNLFGNAGIDVLRGDDGTDTINASDGVADAVVDGGGGTDTIRKDRVDPGNGS